MADAHQVYSEKLKAEIKQIPEEYMPALIDIVHAFRTGVTLKSHSDQVKENMLQGTKEALLDLEAGRLIEGDDVMEWLDTWGAPTELTPKR